MALFDSRIQPEVKTSIHALNSNHKSRFRPLAAHCLLPTAFCLLLTAFCLPAAAQTRWTRQATGTLAWLHAVFFIDQNRGWVVGSKGALLATVDGGKSWQIRPKPTEDVF